MSINFVENDLGILDISIESKNKNEDKNEIEDKVSEEGEKLILLNQIVIIIVIRFLEGRIYYYGVRDRI